MGTKLYQVLGRTYNDNHCRSQSYFTLAITCFVLKPESVECDYGRNRGQISHFSPSPRKIREAISEMSEWFFFQVQHKTQLLVGLYFFRLRHLRQLRCHVLLWSDEMKHLVTAVILGRLDHCNSVRVLAVGRQSHLHSAFRSLRLDSSYS